MRLRGAFAGREGYLQVDGLTISLEDPSQVNVEVLRALLASPARERTLPELQHAENRGLHSYLALRGEPVMLLYSDDKQKHDFEYALGLLENRNSLAMIIQAEDCDQSAPYARLYGDDSAFIHLEQFVNDWEKRGRPRLDQATITAMPIGSSKGDNGSFLVRKKWMEYRINF
jgi:hypothetical protein